MKQYIDTVIDELSDLPIPDAEVFVYNDDATDTTAATLATLYASDGSTEVGNPLTTNAQGEYSFYQETSEFTALVYYGGRLRRRLRLLVGGGYSAIAQASAQVALNAVGSEDYASTAAGLAGTVVGETFWVDNGDGTGSIYRHDTGPVATFLSKFIKDPTGSGASALVGHVAAGSGSSTRPTRDKLREIVSFADKGAPTDGSSATTAINNALGTSRHVEAGSGNYRAQGIVLNQDGQNLSARGAVNILRNANGAIINSAASDITISGVPFYGEDPTYTGDLLTFTGQRGKLLFCAARDTGVNKALKITGSAWLIFGANDVYDGDVEITTDGIGGVSQYHNIIATRISGDVNIEDTAFVSITNCLLTGDITIDKGAGTAGGHGARLLSTRVVGSLTVTQSSTSIGSGMSVSGNVVIGDGTNNYDGITVDPSFVQSGGTFTILSGVKGTFHLGHLYTSGITVTIPASVRQTSNIYHGEIAYTPTITAEGGGFVLGNSVLVGRFCQQGNIIHGYSELTIGDTGVTMSTGGLYSTIPVAGDARPLNCTIEVTKAGARYSMQGRIFNDASDNIILGYRPSDSGADTLFTVTSPVTLAAGDTVRWTFTYMLAGK